MGVSFSRRKLLMGCGLILGDLAFHGQAEATSAVYLTVPQLRRRSSRVVVGRPVLHESEWVDFGGSRRIVTTTRFLQNSDWLRGSSPHDRFEDEILIVTLGGRVGRLAQKVPGEARLPLDEEILLFLGEGPNGRARVMGMSQGAYPVERGETSALLRRSRLLPHFVGPRPDDRAPDRDRPAVEILDRASFQQAFALIRGTE